MKSQNLTNSGKLIYFFLVGVPNVIKYSMTKLSSRLMLDGMEKVLRVNYAENHFDEIRLLLGIAKLYMKVDHVILIAIFVAYGNYFYDFYTFI